MTERLGRKRWASVRLALVCMVAVAMTVVGGLEAADAGDPLVDARRAVAEADVQLADARQDLGDVQEAVVVAQARASEIAQRVGDAQARQADLLAQIAQLEVERDETKDEIDVLRPIVEARAVAAYKGSDESVLDVFDTPDVVDAARRATLLGRAKEHEDDLIADLARLEDELRADQTSLAADQSELAGLLSALEDDQSQIIDALTAAQEDLSSAQAVVAVTEAARTEAFDALATAEAAARRLEAERIAATSTTTPSDDAGAPDAEPDAAADAGDGTSAPTTTAPVSDTPTDGDAEIDTGGSASIICPVDGPVAFADTWGAPRPGERLHEGVDIFSPSGTPNVAVVSGYITQKVGSLSGNGVYLYGDDGNSYWYFHLASFEGSARRVAQGDVIGYTGDTGNAAPGSYHTHWEYHPGHAGPVNPYPIAAAACF